MPLFHGVGPRIRDRLIALKYVRADGKPDVRRFCIEKGYDKTLVYFWLQDRNTPMKELERLARDLGVSAQWLLFGEGKRTRGRRILVSLLLLGATMGWGAPEVMGNLCQENDKNCLLSALRGWLVRHLGWWGDLRPSLGMA